MDDESLGVRLSPKLRDMTVVGEGGLAHPQASFWTLHDFLATSAPFSGVV